jgi:Putative polyhydroxyalkanoic acid system protein (PHA_gran_rgn)
MPAVEMAPPGGTPLPAPASPSSFCALAGTAGHPISALRSSLEVQVSQPVIVSIPHHLGREEAVRRIKSGLAAARSNYSALLNIREETWDGDSLVFNMSTFGQSAAGRIDIAEDHVRLEVTLPRLLAKFAEKLTPAIRKEATLMLEKK